MTPTTDARTTLPLVDANTTASAAGASSCGCGGCGCGTASTSTTTSTEPSITPTISIEQETDMTVPTGPRTQSYSVAGMTCGHCVASVTEELGELPGVEQVNVDLVAGGSSTVTVTSTQPLDDAAVQAAVEEAGYQLA